MQGGKEHLHSLFIHDFIMHSQLRQNLFILIPSLSHMQQSMRENKEKQALGDLMIKPVQRIPRYELLVKVSISVIFLSLQDPGKHPASYRCSLNVCACVRIY